MEIEFEEPQLRQRTIKREHPTPRVAVLAKALLDPVKYDNYKLWRMLSDEKIDEALVIKAAEMIEKSKWKTVDQYDSLHITFPPSNPFMLNLFGLFDRIGKKEQVMNIIKSCINSNFDNEIEAIQQCYNAVKLFANGESNYNAEDTVLGQQYLGHPKNLNANSCWGMHVLAGFITALGASAVAIALVALSGAICTAVAVAGATVGLVGLGLFAYNAYKCSQEPTYNENYMPSF